MWTSIFGKNAEDSKSKIGQHQPCYRWNLRPLKRLPWPSEHQTIHLLSCFFVCLLYLWGFTTQLECNSFPGMSCGSHDCTTLLCTSEYKRGLQHQTWTWIWALLVSCCLTKGKSFTDSNSSFYLFKSVRIPVLQFIMWWQRTGNHSKYQAKRRLSGSLRKSWRNDNLSGTQ